MPELEVEQGEAPQDEPSLEPAEEQQGQEEPQEPASFDPADFEALKQASEERYRKLQAVKDREVTEKMRELEQLKAELAYYRNSAPQQQQQQRFQAEMPEQQDADFWAQLEEDPDKAVQSLKQQVARQVMSEVQARLREEQQEAAHRQAMINEFNQATEGYTEEERQATIALLDDGYRRGQPLSPTMAAIQARYGDVRNMLKLANQNAAGVRRPVAPPVPGVADTRAGVGRPTAGDAPGPDRLQGQWRALL